MKKNLLIILLLQCVAFYSDALCLSGIYTIGGASPNYATITDAVTALNNGGVCGAVTFKIRSGVYNEEVRIHQFLGASASRRVTFESEALDSSVVELRNTDYYSNGRMVFLDSADYVTFKEITFRNVSTNNYYCMLMGNGANHNEVLNCSFYSQPARSDPGGPGFWPDAQLGIENTILSTLTNSFNRIENNHFSYGNVGLLVYANTSGANFDSANVIRNNCFINQRMYGIDGYKQKRLKIVGNTTNSGYNSNITSYSRSGLFLNYIADSLFVSENKIYRNDGENDMYIRFSGTAYFGYGFIYNNYLQLRNSFSIMYAYCLFIDPAGYATVQVSNNTIRGGSNVWTGISIFSNSVISCKNNNVCMEGGNNALYLPSSTLGSYTGDHNNYFSTGSTLIYFNGVNYPTLDSFRVGHATESFSMSKNPRFAESSGYRINAKELDSAGIHLSYVSKDIDGTIRNLTNPDIGCYEYQKGYADAGIINMNSSSLGCAGTNPVIITIRNSGIDTLHSVTVGFTVDGVFQSWFTYSGMVLQSDSVTGINIGSFVSTGNNKVKVFIQNVNGAADAHSYNDTLINNHKAGSLNGTYIIDPSGSGDYLSFQEADSALVLQGVCGAVVFRVKPNVYREQLIVPWIMGASQTNSITFESYYGIADDVVLSGFSSNTTNIIFKLNGAKYFNYRKITFEVYLNSVTLPSYYGNPVVIYNSKHIVFDSCRIKDPPADPYSDFSGAGFCIQNSDSLRITNNIQTGGCYGLYATHVTMSKDILIKNNQFLYNWYGMSATNCTAPVISGNVFEGGSINSLKGVELNYCNGVLFEKNKISQYIYGLGMGNTKKNGGLRPMVVNNFISGGFLPSGCRAMDIFHNNFNMDTLDINTRCVVSMQSDSGLVFINNNFVNKRYTHTAGIYGVLLSTYNPIAYSDYNNFYSPGTSYINTTSPPATTYTLSQWITLGAHDSNSVMMDPQYFSTYDLHISNVALGGLGKPLGIMTDIDGDSRLVPPAIGADEISLFTNINNYSESSDVLIYPNPFSSVVTIVFKEVQANTSIMVMDVMGREIRNCELGIRNSRIVTIDLSGFEKGMYFVRMVDEKRRVVNSKIIKE